MMITAAVDHGCDYDESDNDEDGDMCCRCSIETDQPNLVPLATQWGMVPLDSLLMTNMLLLSITDRLGFFVVWASLGLLASGFLLGWHCRGARVPSSTPSGYISRQVVLPGLSRIRERQRLERVEAIRLKTRGRC